MSLDRRCRIYELESSSLVKEEFMFQKLEKCRFSAEEIDLERDEIEAELESEDEMLDKHALFRDQLKRKGGVLNHNFIKLKYEKRLKLPEAPTNPN